MRNRQSLSQHFLASVFTRSFLLAGVLRRVCAKDKNVSRPLEADTQKQVLLVLVLGPTFAPHACYHYEQTSAARSFTSALILQRVLTLAVASASSYRLLSLAALTCVRRQPVVASVIAMGFRCRGGA